MNFEKIWLSVKTLSTIAIITGIIVIAVPIFNRVMGLFDKKEQLYNEQIIKISEGLVSQRVEINEKLLQAQIDGLNKAILAMVKDRDQTIVQVGKIVAELKQDFSEQIGHVYKDVNDSSKDYEEVVINKTVADGSEIPWSWAMYSPNIKGENKWTTGTYPMKIHTKIAIGENEDRSDAYVEAFLTSEIFKKDKGKKFPIDIGSVEWVKKPPKEKSFMFNPRLSLGVNIGNDIFASIETSLFSYGRTSGDMDWRFIGAGIGASSDQQYIFFTPIEYNIGKPLPFMENLFVSPYVGINSDRENVYGAQIQIPF